MLRTRFTEMFGLDAPLMLALMSAHTGSTIASAVSSAGALGSFGGISMAGPTWITEQVAAVRSVTDKPFAIGFVTQYIEWVRPLFEQVLAERVPALMLSFGDPAPWIAEAKRAGVTVICQVQTPGDADRAVESGADVLVVQGNAAGGHTGTLNLLPFLSTVVERHRDIPVLAAGGIGNGRTLAAVLAAGADGASLGTSFLATTEAVQVHDLYKRMVVESDGTDTVFTRAYDIVCGFEFPGPVGERVRANRFTDRWAGREPELRERRDEFRRDDLYFGNPPDPDTDQILYGEGAGSVTAVRPAAEVVASISASAEQILRSRPSTLLA